jgi:hypothetical protein
MRSLYNGLLLVLLSFVLVQCQKDVSYAGSGDPVVVVPEPVTAHIQGNVTDENNQPAVGVTVTVGTKTATTDADGYFRINQASLDKKSALVTAAKTGYFKAYRSFGATPGTNYVAIKLIKRDLTGTINGTSGGEVALSNGTKIALKANGVVVAATGAAYTGTVNVYAAFIDPTSPDIAERVPGSFMATDSEGSRVGLSSYGMVAVELESAAGEKLQIKSGSTATLNMAIPASLQSSAPASIPLWYIDEQTGIWKEDGSATKSGNSYVGDVKHFSFWNVDIKVPAVTLSLTIKNSDTLPMVHVAVKLTKTFANGSTMSTYGFTDSLGHVSGLIPANTQLTLSVLGNCGTVVHTRTIGPYIQNTNLGVIILPSTTPSVITIKGKLLTCAGTNASNAYALIKVGNMIRYAQTDTAGNYRTTFISCNTTATSVVVAGYDVTNGQHSAPTTTNLTLPVTTVATITACGSTPPPPPPPSGNEFISYVIDSASSNPIVVNISNSVQYDSLTLYISQQGTTTTTTYISGVKNIMAMPANQQSISYNFTSPSPVPGTYTMSNLVINNSPATASVTVSVAPFPTQIGGAMEGSFNGTYTLSSQPGVTHTLRGNFRLIKRF